MTKLEIAREVATEMKRIRPEIEVEHLARVLAKGMLKDELLKALNNKRKNRQAA